MQFLGEISALVTACLWAGTSMVYASITTKIGSVQVNINRMLLSLVWFVLSILIFRLQVDLSRSQWIYLILSAIVGIVFGDSFLFKAFQQIGARISMLVMSLSPAISAVLAYVFLREVLSFWAIVGMAVTLSGIALVILERTPATPAAHTITFSGLLWALFGAFGQGGGIVLAKLAFAEGDIHGLVAAFVRISAALVVMLPAAALTGRYTNPFKLFAGQRRTFLALAIGSFTGTFLGITLSLVAVAHAKVGIASTLIAMSPVVMLPMVKVAYKERLSWRAIAGAMIAVGGVAILFLM